MLRALDRRPSVLSSINRSGSGESIWCSMRLRLVARRNSFFVGAQKPIKAFMRSCGSSGTSVPRKRDIGGGNTYASLENLRLA